jgi:hypothetical protein
MGNKSSIKIYLILFIFKFIYVEIKSMCHSSCASGIVPTQCDTNNDPNTCLSCSSSFIQYVSTSLSPAGECVPVTTNSSFLNLQKLQYIGQSSSLGFVG